MNPYEEAIARLRKVGEEVLDDPRVSPAGLAITHIRLEALKDVEQFAEQIRRESE